MRPTVSRWGFTLAALIALGTVGLSQARGQAEGGQPGQEGPKVSAVEVELLKKAATARANAERAAASLAVLEITRQPQYYENLIKNARTMAAAAEANLAKANAEKEAAEKALAQTSKDRPEARAAAAKLLAAKTAAAKFAAANANSAKTFPERLPAFKAQTEKRYAEELPRLQATLREAAEAEAAALGGLKPLDPTSWDLAKARHLLRRAGFGGTPDEVAKLHALGLYRAVNHLVNFHRTPPLQLPFDAVLPERPGPEEPFRSPQEINMLKFRRQNADLMQLQRLRQWWFQRLIQSPRPLQEKLTLFWHGHFATQHSVVKDSYALYKQNELFREHAAGSFAALLHGIIHDPAMLRYLDNNTNVRGKPNENLARETMELFSMGEGQGYTEKDIMEAARALTGYTFDPHACQFRFLVARHDPAPKTIFGQTGNWNGEDFVDLILRQPATSRFIAGKLFAFLACDQPAPEVVERLAGVLRKCDYELGPMLRNLFLSEEFYSPRAMGTLIKSPVQLMVSLHRELAIKTDTAQFQFQGLDFWTRSMGQELFEPPNVKGWEGGRNWINANVLITRYNTIANLFDRQILFGNQFGPNRQPPQYLDVIELLRGKDLKTPADVVNYLAQWHLAVPLAAEKRQELIAYLGNLPPSSQWTERRNEVNAKLRGLLVLLLASPEYQMT